MADPLETEPGRFNYYKKKLAEEKEAVPQLKEAAPKALEIAMNEANRDAFPPAGFINFREVPNGLDEERFVSKRVDDVLRGTVKYIHELESQPPAYLRSWGILRNPLYEDSDAGKMLVAKTKSDYTRIAQELSVMEDGGDPEFDNPVMNKMSSGDLKDLLDSSLLRFLKEIGVQRSGGASDDMILSHSEKLYEFLSKANTPPQPAAVTPAPTVQPVVKKEEAPAKVKESQKMEPVTTAPAAPVVQQPAVVTTVVEKSQPPVEPVTPAAVTETQNITASEPANIATPETANQPIVPTQESSLIAGSTSGSSISTPLLDILASSSGMSSDEIAKMFQGQGGMENLQKSLDLSLPGSPTGLTTEPVNTGTQASVASASQALKETQAAQVASKVSEPAKMTEPIQAPTAAPTIIQTETLAKPATTEPTPAPEQKVQTEEDKQKSSEAETKPLDEAKNKEQDQTNAELLKVMRDILKALHGPLIFTDGKHNFS